MGCGSAPKQKTPANEIASAQFAAYRQNLDAQYGTGLRVNQLEQANDPRVLDREGRMFAARTNADAAQQEMQLMRSARLASQESGRGIVNMQGDLNTRQLENVSMRSMAESDAYRFAQQRADERSLNAIKAGEEMASLTQNTMASLGNAENNRNISIAKSRQEADLAKAKMWGDIAMSAAAIGKKAYDSNKEAQAEAEENTRNQVGTAPVRTSDVPPVGPAPVGPGTGLNGNPARPDGYMGGKPWWYDRGPSISLRQSYGSYGA